MMEEKLESGRRLARRNMAIASFVLLSAVGTAMVLWGIGSAEAAKNINALTGPIGIVFGCWTSIIGGYLTVSTINYAQRMKSNAPYS